MIKNTNKKHLILGAVLVGALVLTGLQSAGARPWGGGPGCYAPCDDCTAGYGYQARQPDDKTIAARDKFLSETVALRKEMAIKRAEHEALMNSETPDAKRIAQLSGEMFDLREQLQAKAAENGLEGPGMKGLGMGGFGHGAGPCPGPGNPQKPQ